MYPSGSFRSVLTELFAPPPSSRHERVDLVSYALSPLTVPFESAGMCPRGETLPATMLRCSKLGASEMTPRPILRGSQYDILWHRALPIDYHHRPLRVASVHSPLRLRRTFRRIFFLSGSRTLPHHHSHGSYRHRTPLATADALRCVQRSRTGFEAHSKLLTCNFRRFHISNHPLPRQMGPRSINRLPSLSAIAWSPKTQRNLRQFHRLPGRLLASNCRRCDGPHWRQLLTFPQSYTVAFLSLWPGRSGSQIHARA